MLKIIKFLLLFLFLLIILIFSSLFIGIKVNSFSFLNLNISQFYIKFDKKLILNIKKIELKSKKSQVKNSFDDLKKNIELLPNILKYFQQIKVEELKIDGNKFTIQLQNKLLYLDNKFINLSSEINFYGSNVNFKLHSLYLKDLNILFSGKAKVDYFKEKVNFFGNYYYKELNGDINIEVTEKRADFYLNSKEIENLEFIKDFIKLPKIAEKWLYKNIKGKIKLKNLYGSYDLENNILIKDSLKANAFVENARIRFHKDIQSIIVKKINLRYKKDKLDFELNRPKYGKISLDGSRVVIENLTSAKKGNVQININTKAKIDEKILKLLKAYKINLPIKQIKGLTKASIYLKIPYLLSKKMITKGEFYTKNASFLINKFTFKTDFAKAFLNGRKIQITKSNFKYKNMINSIIDLNLDTKTLNAKGNVDIKSFIINSSNKQKILNIKNQKSKVSFDFNKKVILNFEDLNTSIQIEKLINIDINNLSKLYQHSKLLKDLDIKKGNLSLKIKNEKNISFNGNIITNSFPLYRNNKQLTSLNINGKIYNDNINIKSNDKTIIISQKQNKKLDIHLENLELKINTKKTNNLSQNKTITLTGKNITLTIDDKSYDLINIYANIIKNKIDFDGKITNVNLPLKKNTKKVKDLEIQGKYLNRNLSINTKNKDIIVKITNNKTLKININGYDIIYNSENSEDINAFESINIQAKKSNILFNNKYKILSDYFELHSNKETKYLELKYKKTELTFKESKNKQIDIFANNISPEYLNTIYKKNILSGGKLMFLANGTKNNLKGKIIINNTKIDDLAIINNLLLFIQTSPALINPFLAIPSVVGVAKDGFNFTSYLVRKGKIEFIYNKEKESIKIKKLITVGNGIDFDGQGIINLKDLTINSKVKLIFFKDYSSIVGIIPVVNYVLLGNNKRVETQVDIKGSLENPKLSTNLTKDTFSVPVNILKRIITSPLELFNFIKEQNKEKK